MLYTLFKPNPSSSGGLAKFKISKTKRDDTWEVVLFVEFVPQKGWNAERKLGSFDPEKKRFIALNPTEAGEIIHSIETNIPFQSYHKSGDKGCWIKFGSFQKTRTFGRSGDKGFWQGKTNNFAIGISEPGTSISVPIEPGEARCLVQLLSSYIKESMAINAKEEERKFKETKKNFDKPKSEKKEDDVDLPDDVDEDDDVPF